MESGTPEYITRDELSALLSEEAERLPAQETGWWQLHRIDPFPVRYVDRWTDLWHYVIARDGDRILFFADDEDEFATGRLAPGNRLDDYSLFGDLLDAVRGFIGQAALE